MALHQWVVAEPPLFRTTVSGRPCGLGLPGRQRGCSPVDHRDRLAWRSPSLFLGSIPFGSMPNHEAFQFRCEPLLFAASRREGSPAADGEHGSTPPPPPRAGISLTTTSTCFRYPLGVSPWSPSARLFSFVSSLLYFVVEGPFHPPFR